MTRTKARSGGRTRTEGSEHKVQSQFFELIDATGHPAAPLTGACPNGALGGNTRRIMFFIREGTRPGWSDVTTLWAGRGFHFAVIEFKYGDNQLKPNQRRFLERVQAAGGTARVFYDAHQAFKWWCWYVGITEAGA